MESDTHINLVATGDVLLLEISDVKIRHCNFVNYHWYILESHREERCMVFPPLYSKVIIEHKLGHSSIPFQCSIPPFHSTDSKHPSNYRVVM